MYTPSADNYTFITALGTRSPLSKCHWLKIKECVYHSPVLALTATRFYRTYVDEQSTLIAALLMAFHEWMRNLYIRLAERRSLA